MRAGENGSRPDLVFKIGNAATTRADVFGTFSTGENACLPWAGTLWVQAAALVTPPHPDPVAERAWAAVTALGPAVTPAPVTTADPLGPTRVDETAPTIEETVLLGPAQLIRRLGGGAIPRECRHILVNVNGPMDGDAQLIQGNGMSAVRTTGMRQPVAGGFASKVVSTVFTRGGFPVLWIESFRLGTNAAVQLAVWAWRPGQFSAARLSRLTVAAYHKAARALG